MAIDKIPFGTRVREIRKAANLTQIQLAHKAGVGEKTVRRIESNKHSSTLETLNLICNPIGYAVKAEFSADIDGKIVKFIGV